MKKLTVAQKRALGKLSEVWVTAYSLGESYMVLDALVRKGYAKKGGGSLGSCFSPETTFTYRRVA